MGSSDLMSLLELQAGCVWRRQWPIGEERTIYGCTATHTSNFTNDVLRDLHDEERPQITCVLRYRFVGITEAHAEDA